MSGLMGGQKNIYVALWHMGVWHKAGVIVFDKSRNLAGFSYLDTYNGPPVDPVNLDYKSRGVRAFAVNTKVNQNLLHRVFSDALPGAWGLSVLMAEHPALKTMTDAERLAWFGSRTVGGISFRSGLDKSIEAPVRGMTHLEKIRAESVAFHMKKMTKIAGARTKWGLVSHGGARPKVAYEDEDGNHWIAKFNLQLDPYNNARVEHATMRMGARAGLQVPDTKVVALPDGEEVLLVKRFDRLGENRKHQISLFSMMDESRVRGHDQADYMDIFKIIEKASVAPEEDKRFMYKQMMYNVGVNNTDDHAKNFSMILLDEGYRLSPAFDITPNIYDYPHTTSIFGKPRTDMNSTFMLAVAEKIGIPAHEAKQMRDHVAGTVRSWQATFRQFGVGDKDISRLTSQIAVERKIDVSLNQRAMGKDFDY